MKLCRKWAWESCIRAPVTEGPYGRIALLRRGHRPLYVCANYPNATALPPTPLRQGLKNSLRDAMTCKLLEDQLARELQNATTVRNTSNHAEA
jgi:hypothetical protein